MAEDDVERLVAEIEAMHEPRGSVGLLRLARIVRELLAEHPVEECEDKGKGSLCGTGFGSCPPCAARRLRERCNRLARGEK